jgi:hypothetical protein
VDDIITCAKLLNYKTKICKHTNSISIANNNKEIYIYNYDDIEKLFTITWYEKYKAIETVYSNKMKLEIVYNVIINQQKLKNIDSQKYIENIIDLLNKEYNSILKKQDNKYILDLPYSQKLIITQEKFKTRINVYNSISRMVHVYEYIFRDKTLYSEEQLINLIKTINNKNSCIKSNKNEYNVI